MIHIPGRIPITIHWTFFLFSGLIGFSLTQSILGTLIWILLIFLSVLIHEFGHGLTACLFKQQASIELIALGGVTHHQGEAIPLRKQLLILLNGPLFSLLLCGLAILLTKVAAPPFSFFFVSLKVINLFWTAINLLPILPLDGGQLLRLILERIFGLKGLTYALRVSFFIALLVGLASFLYHAFFLGAFFFLFAFQSFATLRRCRHLTVSDRDENLQALFERIQLQIQQGNLEEAALLCTELRSKAKEGLLFALATQYLAYLQYEKGHFLESYQLLLPIKDALSQDARCLLHKTAFESGDFPLVIELGPTCFQTTANAETALLTALAHAQLKEAIPAVGWLRTAIREGLTNIGEVLRSPAFDLIRSDPVFASFCSEQPPS